MNITKKSIITLLLLFAVLGADILMTTLLPETFLLGTSEVSTCYLLIISIIFYRYLDWTMVKGYTRRRLLICAGLITMVFLLRGARYIAFVELNQVMRYLWYLYYIPCILIPFFSLEAVLSVGEPEDRKTSGRLKVLAGVVVMLVVLVLTNDVHQLAFRLNPGFREQWIDEYEYGILYYIVVAYISLMLLASIWILLRKCRISSCRRYIWVPLLPMIFGALMLTLIAIGRMPSYHQHLIVEFPEAYCFTVASSWICCICIGLIPANKAYEELFHILHVKAVITDKKGQVVYSSGDASVSGEDENEDILIRREDIRGGYVYWQSDVRELNQVNRELEEVHQELLEEAELIRLENELREKNAAIEARSQVYDAIAVRVLPQLQRITALTSESEGMDSGQNLNRISFYGSYIKRMSNLMLLEAQSFRISKMELGLAIGESLRKLAKAGIKTSLYMEKELEEGDAGGLICAYERFEAYIEQTLEELTGIYVVLSDKVCKLNLEGLSSDYVSPYSGTSLEYDEHTLFVRIPLEERGQQV